VAFAKPEYCTHYGTIFYESKVIAGKRRCGTTLCAALSFHHGRFRMASAAL
jgi:hypothetical protein